MLSVERESAIQQSKECLRLVEEAKLFHLLPDRRNSFNSERTRPRTKAGLLNVSRFLSFGRPSSTALHLGTLFQSIVCVGGEDDKVVLRSVESWDPMTNVWKQLSCLPFAVRQVAESRRA